MHHPVMLTPDDIEGFQQARLAHDPALQAAFADAIGDYIARGGMGGGTVPLTAPLAAGDYVGAFAPAVVGPQYAVPDGGLAAHQAPSWLAEMLPTAARLTSPHSQAALARTVARPDLAGKWIMPDTKMTMGLWSDGSGLYPEAGRVLSPAQTHPFMIDNDQKAVALMHPQGESQLLAQNKAMAMRHVLEANYHTPMSHPNPITANPALVGGRAASVIHAPDLQDGRTAQLFSEIAKEENAAALLGMLRSINPAIAKRMKQSMISEWGI